VGEIIENDTTSNKAIVTSNTSNTITHTTLTGGWSATNAYIIGGEINASVSNCHFYSVDTEGTTDVHAWCHGATKNVFNVATVTAAIPTYSHFYFELGAQNFIFSASQDMQVSMGQGSDPTFLFGSIEEVHSGSLFEPAGMYYETANNDMVFGASSGSQFRATTGATQRNYIPSGAAFGQQVKSVSGTTLNQAQFGTVNWTGNPTGGVTVTLPTTANAEYTGVEVELAPSHASVGVSDTVTIAASTGSINGGNPVINTRYGCVKLRCIDGAADVWQVLAKHGTT
jgi:hypothetical protein